MSLHPALRRYLDALEVTRARAARDGVVATPASARAALAALAEFRSAVPSVEEVVDAAVVGVPVRVYLPGEAGSAGQNGRVDVVLFVHGGGHVAGDLDVYDVQARRTALATRRPVVSVDYRLAPEWRYPAGLEDVRAVLDALAAADALADVVAVDGADGAVLANVRTTGRVHAVADSGGAAKVASLGVRRAAGETIAPFARQVLVYPSLDYTFRGSTRPGHTMSRYGTGHFLTEERIRWYFDHYFPAWPAAEAAARRDAASPLSGPFASDLPETLVIAAEFDPLRSEAEEYVARARAAGASARLLVAPGMIHAFAFFETLVPDDVDRLFEVVGAFVADGSVPSSW